MKLRLLLVVVVLALVTSFAVPAEAGQIPPVSKDVKLQQRFFAWWVGGDTNPALRENYCGEKVGHKFFLNVVVNPGTYEATCVIPTGLPIVASPAGSIWWYPTDGTTDAELLAKRDASLPSISGITTKLDGWPLRVGRHALKTGVYTIPVAESSFLKTVDPTFPPELTSTRVASGAWLVGIPPLRPGRHTVEISDTITAPDFTGTFTGIFHITVVPRGHHHP